MQSRVLLKGLTCMMVAVLFVVPAAHDLFADVEQVHYVSVGKVQGRGRGCVSIDAYDVEIAANGIDVSGTGTAPPAWDWRDASLDNVSGDWMTPVKSQGACGSCWGFAALGALEAMVNIRAGSPSVDVDLSEQYLLSCPNGGGCSGWNAWWAYRYLRDNGGAITESCFPYEADDRVPCSDKCDGWRDTLFPVTGYDGMQTPPRQEIKAALVEHGPLVAEMAVMEGFGGYTGGVYEHPGEESARDINHQVVIVGYDDMQGCWIVRNSWGQNWGENGYFRIAYGDCMMEHFLIAVDTSPLIARAGGPYIADVGEPVAFDGRESISPGAQIVSYRWEFGDGGSGTGATVSHVYEEEGTYHVRLTITDSTGDSASDTTMVSVDGSAPTVNITRPRHRSFYFFDEESQIPLGVVIIGRVTVEATAADTLSGLDRLEWYLDGERMMSTSEASFRQDWTDAGFGLHLLEARAYDDAGNMGTDKMWVFTWM